MLTLEVFLSPCCLSAQGAKEVAKKAVAQVPGARLVFRCNPQDRSRAKSIGIFIYPAFVIKEEICVVGTPPLEQLINILAKKAEVICNAAETPKKEINRK